MPPAQERETRQRRWLIYGAAAMAGVFLASALTATEGHFVPPIVDLYVVCQYARSFADGHPFQYNAGEAPSTGATSLLFTAVLGLAEAVGIRGEGLVAFAILSGAVLYVVAVGLAYRLAAQLGTHREAVLAAALVLLGGPVVWSFLYGSDIATFMVLFLWLTERLVAGSPGGAAVATTLLALARPEGLPIALIAAASARTLWPGDRRARWFGVPVAAGLAVLAAYRILTGSWVGTSVADKSLLANYGLADSVALVAEYLVDVIRGLLLGLYPASAPVGFAKGWAPFFFPPLGLLLVILAATTAAPARRAAVRVWALMVGSVIILISPTLFMGVHFQRYVLWAVPTLLVFAALGLAVLTRRIAADDAEERRLFASGAGLLLTLGLLSTARFAALYGEMAGDVYRRDVAAARWIGGHLPPGAVIANLATSIEYLTRHRNLNLHGVTSPAFFGGRSAEREMTAFEALGRLTPSERPEYLLTTVSTQEASPTMQEIVQPVPLYRTNSLGDDLVLFRMQHDRIASNRRLLSPGALEQVRGLQKVDELNIGDPRDERAHNYSYRSLLGSVPLYGTTRVAAYDDGGPRVVDSGRAILGGESFVVDARRGRDLLIVVRTTASPEANVMKTRGKATIPLALEEAAIAVSVEGAPNRKVSFRPRAGWDEQVLRIDGARLGAERTRIELSGHYAAFYYWFFQ
jgi:hypothetical protein